MKELSYSRLEHQNWRIVMVVDQQGYRLNVGIVLVNDSQQLFLGRRIGSDAWQFPQGGVRPRERGIDAMYRELTEEIGLEPNNVELLGVTRHWITYQLPEQFIRYGSQPLVIGQRQKWFLLQLKTSAQKIRLDLSATPEFDSWRWVDYWYPLKAVIYFKRQVYRQMLTEFEPLLFPKS